MDNFSALLGKKLAGSGGGSGTSNYNELENKPQINGQTLNGNKTAANLGLQSVINQNNKLDADLIDDSESEKKLVSENDISNWNGKYDSDDAYTKAQTDAAITEAISALDVTETGGAGQYIYTISEKDGKIYATPETMDTVPTSGSTKAVTSGGVQAPLAEVVDAGAKNLLKFVSLSQSYRNGVDFTLNSDGSVTVNGTPSGTAPSYVSLMIAPTTAYDAAEFCDGKHIISGCPSGGGASSYRIQVAKSNYAVYDYGNGAVLSPTTLTGVQIAILIPNGVTVSNLVFKPMICTKAEWDISHEYVLYGKTNAELTNENASQQSEIDYAINTGVKNLASINITSGTYIGFTVTATRETVTVESGATEPSPTANFRILTPSIALKAGTYEITGCPATGTDSTYRLDVRYTGSSGDSVIATEYGAGKSFTLAQDSTVGIFMRFERGYTLTTPITFKPMLCLKSLYDSDNSYQPYAMSNAELTADMSEVQTGLGAVCVLRKIKNSSGTYTYTMSFDDFSVPPSTAIDSCGTYLISILPWSTSPTYSMYTASFTGGNTTDHNVVQKIAGADANVTCTGGVITITSSGKVQIYALR